MARPIVIDDLFRLDVIIDAQVSPNGQTIAFVVKRALVDTNAYQTALYLVPADASATATPIALECSKPLSPRWSPDGMMLAFTCDEDGVRQLFLYEHSAPTPAPKRITSLEQGLAEPVWSPDGIRIAFVSTEGSVQPDLPPNGAHIRHIRRRQYRMDGAGYLDDQFSHVWIVDIANGTTTQLSDGEYEDSSPTWSPDGTKLAFVSNRLNDISDSFCSQIYVLDVPVHNADSSHTTPLAVRRISGETNLAFAPAWSPDGAHIAYIGRRADAPAGGNTNIFLISMIDDSVTNTTADFDRSIGGGVFSDTWSNYLPASLFWLDATQFCFTACDQGRVSVYTASTAKEVRRIVGGERTVGLVSYAAESQSLVYAAGDCINPCDLYTASVSGEHERRITALNAPVLDELVLQQPQLLRIKSLPPLANVDAWLLRPVGYSEGETYPLVQYIHGGPHSTFGYTFFFDMQLLAAHGWNVLYVNPRGSQGYGETHAACNIGQWGDGDWPEQEAALDQAIALGGVDANNLGVTGLSYGGFMVNWIITRSQRYRAAISENGISNLVSFYANSDIGWFWLERELGLSFWDHVPAYLARSPLFAAPQVMTPLLLLNGEQDYRCPIDQSEQFFTALRAHNVAAEMVRFPGESHMLLLSGKPQSRRVRREHILRWFEQHFVLL